MTSILTVPQSQHNNNEITSLTPEELERIMNTLYDNHVATSQVVAIKATPLKVSTITLCFKFNCTLNLNVISRFITIYDNNSPEVMSAQGQIIMVKHAYSLPRGNVDVAAEKTPKIAKKEQLKSEPPLIPAKRGRKPKPKPIIVGNPLILNL